MSEIVSESVIENRIGKIPSYIVRDANGLVPISVLVHIMSIYNIDTVKQRFECKFVVQLRWSAREEGDWVPSLDFVNNLGELKVQETKVRSFQKKYRDEYEVACTYLIQGQFFERFEVNYFPFDAQRLQILAVLSNCPCAVMMSDAMTKRCDTGSLITTGDHVIYLNSIVQPIRYFGRMVMSLMEAEVVDYSEESEFSNASNASNASDNKVVMNEIELPSYVVLRKDGTALYEENFVQHDSWSIMTKAIELREGKTLYERDEHGVSYTSMRIVVNIERKFGFYFWNIIFPVFILVNLSFTSFMFAEDALIDRLTVTLTLILTMFALKFAVSQYLPPTNYLTVLDRYVVFSYIILSIVACQNMLCLRIYRGNALEAERFNHTSAGILIGFWGFVNMIGVGFIGFKKLRLKLIERRRLKDDRIYASERAI